MCADSSTPRHRVGAEEFCRGPPLGAEAPALALRSERVSPVQPLPQRCWRGREADRGVEWLGTIAGGRPHGCRARRTIGARVRPATATTEMARVGDPPADRGGALFVADHARARSETRAALAAMGDSPDFTVGAYARLMAARVFAWSGASDEAVDLLVGVCAGESSGTVAASAPKGPRDAR
jgi:hypothetical protein